MPMKVRPWKPPAKAMTAERPVAARAIFTAFSTASDPELNNADFFAELGSPGGASKVGQTDNDPESVKSLPPAGE